jgi:2-polyprenyl-3-methyl-5-hydroxy-6-metoxy-1,4-benzoquinol methylase
MPPERAGDRGFTLEARARRSGGTSRAAIYAAVVRAIERRNARGGTLLDLGCGAGRLWPMVRHRFARYVGIDAIRHEGFPAEGRFIQADLDRPWPVSEFQADVAVAVETIEHLENPRQFVRHMAAAVKPGGLLVVTTPNQRSLLSLATLVVKGSFSAFQDGEYPAHLTALLELDLRRIAAENRVSDVEVAYSNEGRIPGLPLHYPAVLSKVFPRALSDNLLLSGRAPAGPPPGVSR